MTLEDVIVHIWIKEKNKSCEKTAKTKEFTLQANLIEERHDKPDGNHNKQNNKLSRSPTHRQNPKRISIEVINETKNLLSSMFDVKDLGEADVIFEIKLNRLSNGYEISQEHFVEKVLRKFDHFDCSVVSTPYEF
ncbi:hypothetical protein RJ639_028936 [Escallonia herrerae]|uniref:Reverse transcriptase Ty1/copia-type domain-containing protein n=1 Tax=Escallonia herrerae TaxID=1293975 RepID=A0AA88X690_9ASTE|nr:hypothetical protein RJ639_028936 [Escallonia herrerae]